MCRYRYKYKTRKHKDQNFVTTMLEEQKQKRTIIYIKSTTLLELREWAVILLKICAKNYKLYKVN